MKRWVKWLAIVVAFVLCIGALSVGSAYAVGGEKGVAKLIPEPVGMHLKRGGLDGCASWWLKQATRMHCYAEEFTQMITRRDSDAQGLRRDFHDFDALAARDKWLDVACHGIMHEVGDRVAIAQKLDSDEITTRIGVLTKQIGPCTTGFMHGMIETIFRDFRPGDSTQPLFDYCQTQEEGVPRMQCDHGLGHVMFRASRGDIKVAQEQCAKLGRAQGGDCGSAAWHEFWIERSGTEIRRWPDAKKVKERLESVPGKKVCRDSQDVYLTACWIRILQVVHVQKSIPTNLAQLEEPCRKAPRREHASCMAGSVSRISLRAVWAKSPAPDQMRLCAMVKSEDDQRECQKAVDIRHLAKIEMMVGCEKMLPGVRADCYEWQAHNFSFTFPKQADEVEAACGKVANASYRAACLGGLKIPDSPATY